MARARVTGRQILEFCLEQKIIILPQATNNEEVDRKNFESAYRAVRRWIVRHGYKRGKRTGNVVMKDGVVEKRDQFLLCFFRNRNLPEQERLREVYLDESYIHHHYRCKEDSVWDPNDDQDLQFGKAPGKGRRYCFVAAIQGPNPRGGDSVEDRAGLVPGSVWKFSPNKKELHFGDYHKVFNGKNFVTWFKEQLLPGLHCPSLIMMDNAAYHVVFGEQVPVLSKMKREDCRRYLESKNTPYPSNATVAILKALVKTTIVMQEKRECVRLAEENGHTILFTPPYHSDLQPIELVWAQIKGRIGRQYSKDTTLEDVREQLEDEFQDLLINGSESIWKMIEKCAAVGQKFLEDSKKEEELDPIPPCNDDEDNDDDDIDDASFSESEHGLDWESDNELFGNQETL